MVVLVYGLFGLALVVSTRASGYLIAKGSLTAVGATALAISLWFTSVMALVAYTRCVVADPGGVPESWHPFQSDEEAEHALE